MGRKVMILGITGMILLASCVSAPASTPVPTLTLAPAGTSTLEVPIIYLKNGGFSLALQPGLEFEIDDASILLFDTGGEHFVSLHGRPYIASIHTLESFLSTYLDEITARGASFDQGDPYEISIDGISGIAIDLHGSFSDAPMAGMAVAVSPGKDFIIFGMGLSNLQARERGWAESGSVIFEAILDSIKFREEAKRSQISNPRSQEAHHRACSLENRAN